MINESRSLCGSMQSKDNLSDKTTCAWKHLSQNVDQLNFPSALTKDQLPVRTRKPLYCKNVIEAPLSLQHIFWLFNLWWNHQFSHILEVRNPAQDLTRCAFAFVTLGVFHLRISALTCVANGKRYFFEQTPTFPLQSQLMSTLPSCEFKRNYDKVRVIF